MRQELVSGCANVDVSVVLTSLLGPSRTFEVYFGIRCVKAVQESHVQLHACTSRWRQLTTRRTVRVMQRKIGTSLGAGSNEPGSVQRKCNSPGSDD